MGSIERRQPTPWHLWLVGALSFGWNGLGTFDLVMTITRGAHYLRGVGLDEASIRYYQALPPWMYAPWALGVCGGVIAALYLLVRRKAALSAYALSLLGAVGSNLVQKYVVPAPQISGPMSWMPYVIIALALLQWLYAHWMRRRDVLI